MLALRWTLGVIGAACFSAAGFAQAPVKTVPATAGLPVASSTAGAEGLLQGGAAEWAHIAARKISLNRTPPLFDTDEPASVEVSTADVRCLRAGGKLYVQLSWRDATHDVAILPAVPDATPEKRFHKLPTEADDRFFDAAAVMAPASPSSTGSPGLQMGDADHPVQIYYWNATRGAMLMTASGRATTQRTGRSFPARGVYQANQWVVTFELADLPAGTPLAFAIWNGSQKDRDGRKYFSVWYTLE